MRGRIVSLAFHGDDGSVHPHVIILEIGDKECLVVPGYAFDGHAINETIAALKKCGYREEEIFVELDNSKCVVFSGSHTGKKCRWMIARAQRVSTRLIKSAVLVGTMKNVELVQITKALIELARVRTELVSPRQLKALQQLVK